jgi:hypothetical protein
MRRLRSGSIDVGLAKAKPKLRPKVHTWVPGFRCQPPAPRRGVQGRPLLIGGDLCLARHDARHRSLHDRGTLSMNTKGTCWPAPETGSTNWP